MDDFVISLDAKAYRCTAAGGIATAGAAGLTAAAPSLIIGVSNVTLGMTRSEADVTTRGNDGWEQIKGTVKRLTVDMELPWKDGDADIQAFRDAFLDGTPIGMAILSGDIATAGSEGPAGNFSILGFGRDENLEGNLVAKIQAKPHSNMFWFEKEA